MTISSLYPRLFQIKPKHASKGQHANSWKNLTGHDRNQHRLRKRHYTNAKLTPYKLAGTINILKDMIVKEIRQTWAKITRKLRKANVRFWWIREVSRRSNRVHYHLITSSDHTPEQIKQLIRASCPTLRFVLKFDPITGSEWQNYICKSTDFAGRTSYYANKVVLFEDKVGLEKHGEVNGFWQKKPKKRTPQENQARREYAHKFQEAANDYLVSDAAEHLADATGLPELEILEHYARELIADPTAYQAIAEDAFELRGQTPYKVGPFQFTPAPAFRKPPVRKKKAQAPKALFPPFDPNKCDSITFSGEINTFPPEPDNVTEWEIDL